MLKVDNYKRLIAYSSIEHMGLITIGIAVGGIAYFAVILHLIIHSFTKAEYLLPDIPIRQGFQNKTYRRYRWIFQNKPIRWSAGNFTFSCDHGYSAFRFVFHQADDIPVNDCKWLPMARLHHAPFACVYFMGIREEYFSYTVP